MPRSAYISGLVVLLLLSAGCGHHSEPKTPLPKTKTITLPENATWSVLREHMRQAVKDRNLILVVNGTPFHFPVADKDFLLHRRTPSIQTTTHTLDSNDLVDSVTSWLGEDGRKCVSIQVGEDVAVQRVINLVQLCNEWNITIYWKASPTPGSSITTKESDAEGGVVEVLPMPGGDGVQ